MADHPTWAGVGAGDARARRAVVGVGRLRVADERHRSRGGRGPDRRCSPRWRRCWSPRSASRRRSATGRSRSRSPTASSAVGAHRALPAREPRRPRAAPLGPRASAVSTAIGVGLLVGASFLDGPAQARALGRSRSLLDCGGPLLVRHRGLEARARATSPSGTAWSSSSPSASRSSPSASAREVDLTRRRRRRRGARDRARRRAVVDLLRRRRARHRAAPRRAAERGRERNRSPATRTPTCTSRWSPGIVLAALGLEETLAHVDDPLDAGARVRAARRGRDLPARPRRAPAAATRTRSTASASALALVLFALIPAGDRTSPRSRRSRASTCCSGR